MYAADWRGQHAGTSKTDQAPLGPELLNAATGWTSAGACARGRPRAPGAPGTAGGARIRPVAACQAHAMDPSSSVSLAAWGVIASPRSDRLDADDTRELLLSGAARRSLDAGCT